MALDERSRHDLYKRLEQVLGHDHATVLMEHLPPVGWADVATKRDLDQLAAATKRDLDQVAAATKRDIDQLEARLDLRFEASEQKLLATFRADLNAQTRSMVQWLIFATAGATLAVGSLAFAAARLV